MNVDDPKLTAYALGELASEERAEIEKLVAASPEAQRFVSETHDLAAMLKTEYVAEAGFEKTKAVNLIDIRDDPWFWSVARPLAVAALITVCAIVGAITIAKHQSRSDSNAASAVNLAVEGEEKPQTEARSEFVGPESVRNPVRPNVIQRIERVVIGELDPASTDGKIRVIETIDDAYRIQHLKGRLTTPVLFKKSGSQFVGAAYQLMFVDRDGHIVASASLYHIPDVGFVLQPSRYGYFRDGHYFASGGNDVLPGDWESGIDYRGYVIPFPDWVACIGYSPGA